MLQNPEKRIEMSMRNRVILVVFLTLGLASCQPGQAQTTPSAQSSTQAEASTAADSSSVPTATSAHAAETGSQPMGTIVCGSEDDGVVDTYNQALRLQQSGDWNEAKTLYKQAIERDPGYCDAMDNLGLILRQEGDLAGAIEWYLRSIDLAPHNNVARMNLAVAYDHQGQTEMVIAQYEAITADDPRNPEGYYGLAGIYMDQERYAEAAALFREAVNLYEVSGSTWIRDAYYGLGISLAAAGQCGEAVEHLEHVYDEFVYDAYLNYNLGYCYLSQQLGDPEWAQTYIARAYFLGMELPEDIWSYLPRWDLQIAEDLLVVYGYFGIFEANDQGSFFFPTIYVPYREDLEYGWLLFVETERTSLLWREEYKMPSPPQSWGSIEADGYTSISADRCTATTDFRSELLEPVIGNSWILQSGDPSGDHEMRIYVEDEYVTTFKFVVSLQSGGS